MTIIRPIPGRTEPARLGRSISALKLLNILRDVTGDVIIDGAPGLATPLTLTLGPNPNPNPNPSSNPRLGLSLRRRYNYCQQF